MDMSVATAIVDHEPDQPGIDESWGAEMVNLLGMLARDPQGLTVKAIQSAGIEAPAQAIYMLQLAGYRIDRVADFQHGTLVYRLARVGRDNSPGGG